MKLLQQVNQENDDITKKVAEIYIPSEKRQQIIDILKAGLSPS